MQFFSFDASFYAKAPGFLRGPWPVLKNYFNGATVRALNL